MAGKLSLKVMCLLLWLDPASFTPQVFDDYYKRMVLAFHPDRHSERMRPVFEGRMKQLNEMRDAIRQGNYVDDR